MTEPSPLAEASITSLDELFSRDPLSLSQQDLAAIVVELRRQRQRYIEAEAAGKRAPRAEKVKPQAELLEDL